MTALAFSCDSSTSCSSLSSTGLGREIDRALLRLRTGFFFSGWSIGPSYAGGRIILPRLYIKGTPFVLSCMPVCRFVGLL